MKKRLFLFFFGISCCNLVFAQQTITETMGTVSATTSIAAQETANGFDQDWLTYSGSGDLRKTSASTGYTGASGGANVFLTAASPTKAFSMSGLTPNSSCGAITLSFGAYKSTAAITTSLFVEYTTATNTAYTSAGTITLGTGASWSLVSGITLPLNVSSIRFTNSNTSGTQFRIDDVTIAGTGAGCSLPVKLVSFAGQSATNAVVLNWSTAWEEKNEGFDILKGKSATDLEKVGFIAGQTTTQALSSYSFTDTDVQDGQLYYYQLNQRDIGGGSALSKMIAVRASSGVDETPLVVYPNPNKGSFTLSGYGQDASSIKLYNAFGTEIPISVSESQTANTLFVSAKASLPAGMYYLLLQDADAHQRALKVIVH